MNVSSSTTSSADWAQLLMQRAASGSQTSQPGQADQAGNQQFAFSMDDGPPPPPPPPPPIGPGDGGGSGASTLQIPSASLGTRHGHVHGGKDPLASLDADGDGSVSSDEFGLSGASDAQKKLFSAIDSDGNGSLSSAELGDFKSRMGAAMQAKRAAEESSSASVDSSSASKAAEALTQLLAAIDTNGDGSVSSTEISDFKTQMTNALPSMQSSTSASGDASSSTCGNSSSDSSSSDSSSSDNSSSAALQALLQRISQEYASLSASGYFSASSGNAVNLTA